MFDLILAFLTIGLAIWGASKIIERRTVYEYQHALLFNRGTYSETLTPGIYWYSKLNSRVEVIDARLQILTVPGQEILTKDGVTLKISALVECRVKDAKTAALVHADYLESLYALVQKELRLLVGESPVEKILEEKEEIGRTLHERLGEHCSGLGLEIKSTSIKDIMFPGALKEAFSQVARARQEGLAVLERTRGESAALRNLANAAKLVESNPELYRLRLLQSVSGASSVVLHLDSDEKSTPDAGGGSP